MMWAVLQGNTGLDMPTGAPLDSGDCSSPDWLWQLWLEALPRIQFAVGLYWEKLHAWLHLLDKAQVKTSKIDSSEGFGSRLKTWFPQKATLENSFGKIPSTRVSPSTFLSLLWLQEPRDKPEAGACRGLALTAHWCCTGSCSGSCCRSIWTAHILSDKESGVKTLWWGC